MTQHNFKAYEKWLLHIACVMHGPMDEIGLSGMFFFFKQMMPLSFWFERVVWKCQNTCLSWQFFFSANTANNYELYRVVVSNILSSY